MRTTNRHQDSAELSCLANEHNLKSHSEGFAHVYQVVFPTGITKPLFVKHFVLSSSFFGKGQKFEKKTAQISLAVLDHLFSSIYIALASWSSNQRLLKFKQYIYFCKLLLGFDNIL